MTKHYRLFGTVADLERTGSNSACTYYRLMLYIRTENTSGAVSAEQGFNGYNKKQIYKILKEKIKADLFNTYGITAV